MPPFLPSRKIIGLLAFAAFLMGLFSPSSAEARGHHPKRHLRKAVHRVVPVPHQSTYADLVIDGDTGLVLHADNPYSIRHPASLTKMMTLYITFQALEAGRLRMDQRLWVSANAANQSPTKLGLHAGQTIRVQDAILGLITESANDAAMVLAEGIGGDEESFAQQMTRQAQALGMTRTHFENPNGLPDPDQVTCAADMVRLGYALIHHYPQYYTLFSHEEFVYAGVTHRNHNHLMERYEGMDGIKTGYIRMSGFNLVASAVRNQTRVVAAIFGGTSAPSRDKEMENLLDNAFRVVPIGTAKAPVILVGQGGGDANQDGVLNTGDYVSLPQKTPVLFQPPNRGPAPVRQEIPAPQQQQDASAQPRPAQQPVATQSGGQATGQAVAQAAPPNVVPPTQPTVQAVHAPQVPAAPQVPSAPPAPPVAQVAQAVQPPPVSPSAQQAQAILPPQAPASMQQAPVAQTAQAPVAQSAQAPVAQTGQAPAASAVQTAVAQVPTPTAAPPQAPPQAPTSASGQAVAPQPLHPATEAQQQVASVQSKLKTTSALAPTRTGEAKEDSSRAAESGAPKQWAIQIGAYADPTLGQKALVELAKSIPILRGASPVVQQVRINNTALYRARFLKLDEKGARSACSALARERKNCLVLMPTG